jgi:hypothetical protein
MRRRRCLCLLRGLAAAVTLTVAAGSVSAADAVAKLCDALGSSHSFKVRVQAAALLGRLHDPRAGQALVRASASDPSAPVRGLALKLLAKRAIADRASVPIARQAMSRALGDDDAGVRRQAAAALVELERTISSPARTPGRPARAEGPTTVAIGVIGDRTGHASRALRDRMRAEMRSLLAREPRLQLLDGEANVAFLIDGTISKLTTSQGGPDVEAVCAVDLVVSRGARGIVSVASGEATVQKPRSHYQPILREHMEQEAMENAVRGAHENLARFLAAQ